jgi:uncharacterized protein YyaL (SSP411 family)
VKPLDGKPTAYVCENYVCHTPTPDLGKLASLLKAGAAVEGGPLLREAGDW